MANKDNDIPKAQDGNTGQTQGNISGNNSATKQPNNPPAQRTRLPGFGAPLPAALGSNLNFWALPSSTAISAVCFICQRTFSREDILGGHMRRVHCGTKCYFTSCGRTFDVDSAVGDHLLEHNGGKEPIISW
ncbi:uncharacterized protein BCR38DRAFT_412846 [Pseudomassariella vexata]|uniref:C2H2-type domain-containing protein n=1 Tax=Pseudomassariella vexata TaxID=1141098 RepID=A0A1Y2DIT4_9PEZI|nr:uncharacterized protein BCR38DRAFT_412846 [Pseudomassariella vexata]ORY59132.1 hypothetical protein BCR38DRAFT_412846 [Pseudomassariella vexata]